jgi:carbon storage regulator
MLVLSRKSRQSVVVGGSGGFHRLLKVTVLGIKGANVKLGFEVDGDVPVHRSEVWERIQAGRRLDGMPEDSSPLLGGVRP